MSEKLNEDINSKKNNIVCNDKNSERINKIEDLASYCLNCVAKPCSKNGCPLSNDIPSFIKYVKEGNIEEAYKILSKTTVLGAICGRICPHEKQCQGSCVRGIKGKPVSIGELEAYVFDKALERGFYKKMTNEKLEANNQEKGIDSIEENIMHSKEKLTGKKVAIVGGGPARTYMCCFLSKK